MSQCAQFIFTPRRGRIEHLAVQLPHWVHDLVMGGFALDSEWGVLPIASRQEVRVKVHMVTKPAARAALRSPLSSWEWIEPHLQGKPTLEWIGGTQAVPTCRCKASESTPMLLWATPRSKCPPLLCSKGGTIAFYALGINEMILRRLHSWHRFACSIAEVQFAQGVDVINPYSKWAEREGTDRNSELNKLGVALAGEIERDIGRTVIYKAPPFHFFKL